MLNIKYYAYKNPDSGFEPDAFGAIKNNCKTYGIEDDTVLDANYPDDCVLKDEYIWVSTEDGEAFVVAKEDIYTEVIKESALYSGWGKACPTGGLADAEEPELEEDGRFYIRFYW